MQAFQFVSSCSKNVQYKDTEGNQFVVQYSQSHYFCHQCEEYGLSHGGVCH